MMLVNPVYRSRGLGARLLEAAMGAIPPDLPIRLDATPLGRPLYERYGFVLESSLTRLIRWADAGQPPARSGAVRPLAEPDLPPLLKMDERISGARRHGPLRWAFADAPRYAWIGSLPAEGGSHPKTKVAASGFSRKAAAGVGPPPEGGRHADTSGYCLGRGGRLFDHVGPIVADSAESAASLAAAAIDGSGGGSLVIDAHDSNEAFVAWLRGAQFEPQRPLYRMCRPVQSPVPSRPAGPLIEFAIMGPEFS
jgi:hypothetical protein